MTRKTLAATATAIFAAGAFVAAAQAQTAGSVKCTGVNSCKGTSACKTAFRLQGPERLQGPGLDLDHRRGELHHARRQGRRVGSLPGARHSVARLCATTRADDAPRSGALPSEEGVASDRGALFVFTKA